MIQNAKRVGRPVRFSIERGFFYHIWSAVGLEIVINRLGIADIRKCLITVCRKLNNTYI